MTSLLDAHDGGDPMADHELGGPMASGSRRTLPPWSEPLAVAAVLTIYCIGLTRTIGDASGIFLPPDAAHALGEADVLLGRGVLGFAHPPAFAAIVVVMRAVLGDVAGAGASYLLGVALLWLALYGLLRQWFGPVAAVVGTMTGMCLPLVGELIGWGGGAQLIGIGLGVATLALFERWCRRGRGAVLVGLGVGLTSLAHPFGLVALGACLAVRWVAELRARPRAPARRRAPTTLRGGLTCLAAAIPFVLLGIPYYGTVSSPGQVSLALPTMSAFVDLLSWATRESPLLLILCLVAFGTVLFARQRRTAAISGALAALIVLPLVFVRAEAGYLTRSLYYLPVLVAIAVAVAWDVVASAVAPRLDRARLIAVAVTAALLIPGLVASVGLGPRLRAAIPYYTLVGRPEVDLLGSLRGGDGAVATSWSGVSAATGSGLSWYVSGLAGRHAYGPSGPWIGAQPEEQRDGLAMQRAFSGDAGVDGGGVQAAGHGAELAVQVRVPGVYGAFAFPAFVLGTSRDPTTIEATVHASNESVTSESADGGTLEGSVQDNALSVRHSNVGNASPLWIRPAAGLTWSTVGPAGPALHVEEDVAGQRVGYDIASTMIGTRFVNVTDGLGAAAIRVDVPAGQAAAISVHATGVVPPQPTVAYARRDIFASYGITNLVLFRSSGTVDDFDPRCFTRTGETSVLVVLRAEPGCPVRR